MENLHKHPLEGKYIIYNYGHQDHAGEGWALALFQLKNETMREVYHPANHVMQLSDIGDTQTNELLELMIQKDIRKVYSVWHIRDFFGIPANWFSLHPSGEEIGEVELWAEYQHIEKGGSEHQRLMHNGIEVIFYDEPYRYH